jgi:hypothetical protein
MNEREFWTLIRQALLLVISAIDKRYKIGKYRDDTMPHTVQEIGERDNMTRL